MAKIIIFSGAGISAESGISTFRDSNGLWENYDVKDVCYFDSLDKNEKMTIEFYDKRRVELQDKEPNKAHKEIAKLKEKYPNDIAIITQNVDNLFEKAGINHDNVIHLHGFMTEVRCRNNDCNTIFDIEYKKQEDAFNGKCPTCYGKIRPNIVFFGEQAPLYDKIYEELNDCEIFVVIGTSGNVVNTDSLIQYAKYSILNNLDPSDAIFDKLYSKVLYKPATQAIDEIIETIEYYLMHNEFKNSREDLENQLDMMDDDMIG
jgi:NAD-dependent deacetylase